MGPFSNMTGHIFYSPLSHLVESCVSVCGTRLVNIFFFPCAHTKKITMVLYQNTDFPPGTHEATVSAAAKSHCCAGILLQLRWECTGGKRSCRFCFLSCHWSDIWPLATHFPSVFPPVLASALYIAAVVNRDSRDFGRFIWDATLMWSCALAN